MSHNIIVVSGMAFEAKLAQGNAVETIYGLNLPKLLADIESAIKKGAEGILSFGTAAGLSPALEPGSIIIAKKIYLGQQVFTADEKWCQQLGAALPRAIVANMAGVDNTIATPKEKVSLHEATKAVAADMESHHVAGLAQQYNLPFAVLRVVLDDATRALPPAALAGTQADGSINYFGLLRSLCINPAQIPALIKLSGDHAKAKKALAYCSQTLSGSRFGFDLR